MYTAPRRRARDGAHVFAPLVLTVFAGVLFFALTALAPQPAALAGPGAAKPVAKPHRDLPPLPALNTYSFTAKRPSPRLNRTDFVATLHAIHIALSRVADGSTYVWHRNHGRLGGFIRPTASFKDAGGQICRHIVLMLNSGRYVRQTEGIACRDADGGWALTG